MVTIGSWRNRQTRHAQTVQIGGSNPREPTNHWNHPEGDIVEGQDAALSAREYGFESRCPRQDGRTDAEGRDGDLGGLISLEMRVRFPPPRPWPVRPMEGRRSYKPHTGVRFPHRLPVQRWAKANGARSLTPSLFFGS